MLLTTAQGMLGECRLAKMQIQLQGCEGLVVRGVVCVCIARVSAPAHRQVALYRCLSSRASFAAALSINVRVCDCVYGVSADLTVYRVRCRA